MAQLLDRLREGNQTKEDIEYIKAMEYTDVSTWPEVHVRLYLANNLKDAHYISSIYRLLDQDSSRILYTSHAIDLKKDVKTGAMQVNVDLNIAHYQNRRFTKLLKICVGAAVTLTYNKNQYWFKNCETAEK